MDEEKDLEKIRANCELLVAGWFETTEYKVPMTYHRAECKHRAKTVQGCSCPVANEVRSKRQKIPGLLEQLDNFKVYQDTDREPRAERQAPRVKKVKYHPEFQGYLTLDEITCDVTAVVDRTWYEAGLDRHWAAIKVKDILVALPRRAEEDLLCRRRYATPPKSSFAAGFWAASSAQAAAGAAGAAAGPAAPDRAASAADGADGADGQDRGSRPDLVRQLRVATDRWVGQARRALRLTVSDAMFGDTVCGNCGGGLAVPVDNSGDVRCVGSPVEAPCGETYPMAEWVSLYERGRRDQ